MRRFVVVLLSATVMSGGAANAADLPMKAPVYAPPVPLQYNWTGCYLGGQLGGGWARTPFSNTASTAAFGDLIPGEGFRQTDGGFIGGGQLGCNYQTGAWVFGLEGTFAGSTFKGNVANTFVRRPRRHLHNQDRKHRDRHRPHRLCRGQLAVLCQGRLRRRRGEIQRVRHGRPGHRRGQRFELAERLDRRRRGGIRALRRTGSWASNTTSSICRPRTTTLPAPRRASTPSMCTHRSRRSWRASATSSSGGGAHHT